MSIRKINWPIWTGFLLSLIAFFSYPVIFVRFPVTRDFPWANLALFGLATVFLVMGLRRAFARESSRPKRSKIAATLLATLGLAIFGFFILAAFVIAKRLPASQGAPQVGKTAPEFTLPDTNGKPVALSELRSAPIKGTPPKGVLLVFYRGYW